jgi:hypothetical protein
VKENRVHDGAAQAGDALHATCSILHDLPNLIVGDVALKHGITQVDIVLVRLVASGDRAPIGFVAA